MPRSSCLPCCNPVELGRSADSYRPAVLQVLCAMLAELEEGTSGVRTDTFVGDLAAANGDPIPTAHDRGGQALFTQAPLDSIFFTVSEPIATTSRTTILAAPGSGLRYMVTDITIATTSPEGAAIEIASGLATPLIRMFVAGKGSLTYDTYSASFPVPRPCNLNEAITAISSTEDTYRVTVGGYILPY